MIKGLIPQLAERGKIKIGMKGEKRKGQGGKEWRLPVKLDHFIITTMERDKDDQLIRDLPLMQHLFEVQKEKGCGRTDKLVEIPIRLLYDEIELNFQTRLACYKSMQLPGEKAPRLRCWCSGDNERAQRLQMDGTFKEGPCPCERSDPGYDKADKCKFLGTLQCLIDGTDRIGGVWKFRTTSYNSVNAIYASLLLIKAITGGGCLDTNDMPIGPLAGIPLKMMISPKTVTVPAGPQAGQNMVIHVVSLEYVGSEEQLAQIGYDMRHRLVEHQIRMNNLERHALRAIVGPHQEPLREQEETAEEFLEPEFESVTEDTTARDLAEFSQRLKDCDLPEDDSVLVKFLEAKAQEGGASVDEAKIAAVVDWIAFFEEFEKYQQSQQSKASQEELDRVQAQQGPPITEMTMTIIKENLPKSKKYTDLADLLARERVKNLADLTEARGSQIVDLLNNE